MTKTIQMKESLSEKKLETLGSQLKSLPTAEEFKQKAETDFWKMFAGQSHSDEEEVDYENLSDSSKKLIGTISSDSEEVKIPWWFEEFKWAATSIGEKEIALNAEDRLARFQEFVPRETIIKRPELLHERMGTSNDIYGALENSKAIHEELAESLDFDFEEREDTSLSLPDNMFTTQNGGIRTTSDFREWFDSLVNLCPPFNEQLTVLLMLNTKVEEDISEEILPPDLIALIRAVGMTNNSRIYNENYFKPLESLITYQWQVFDLHIPYINETYDYLSPLEAALFESWAENNPQFVNENKSIFYIDEANRPSPIDNEARYAQIAFRSPLTRKKGRSVFITLSLRSNGRYSTSSGEQGKRREIDKILESYAGIETDG